MIARAALMRGMGALQGPPPYLLPHSPGAGWQWEASAPLCVGLSKTLECPFGRTAASRASDPGETRQKLQYLL